MYSCITRIKLNVKWFEKNNGKNNDFYRGYIGFYVQISLIIFGGKFTLPEDIG